MSDKTETFIIRHFKKYYVTEKIEVPERLSRREFGFMFFDKTFVIRHIGFTSRQDLKSYLAENVPSHVYYSSAYYKHPNAQKMADKEWMGADLIFDLDADHVRGIEGMSYPQMLQRVKQEIMRLHDEFITGDLGFDSKHVKIVFSGGRGYHVHVTDPRVLSLGSHERREIVDYITGTELNFDWVFPSEPFDAKKFAERVYTIRRKRMPSTDSGGWKGRMSSGIRKFLSDMEVMGEKEAVKRFSSMKEEGTNRSIGEKTIKEMYHELFGKRKDGKRGSERIIDESNFEIFSRQPYLTAFLQLVESHVKVALVGETDEPVTSDIRRLIRLPSSLHGKTGLRVTCISREELNDFDPLRDAVPAMLTDRAVKMKLKEKIDIELRGERIALSDGENEVPEFFALFLACRKTAEIV